MSDQNSAATQDGSNKAAMDPAPTFAEMMDRPTRCVICERNMSTGRFIEHWHEDHAEATWQERLRQAAHDNCACYHEINCRWLLWANDSSLFTEMPECSCNGDEIIAFVLAALDNGQHIAPPERADSGS